MHFGVRRGICILNAAPDATAARYDGKTVCSGRKLLKWLKPATKRKRRLMLILKGFFESEAGAARQD
jgi:hypothetical protein